MKKKSEIKNQIKLLKLQRTAIARHSFFGDDNHSNIDRQVEILEEALNLDEMDLEELQEASHEEGDEAVLQAYDWVLGNLAEDLVESDDPFVKKALAVKKQ